ncbi:conserved protein of unknown function [Candidatus Methylocalor cossyra]|uniref:Transglycosylase SLT domain-containing protein n=1 Tax=Candidatus Methylocalor cossyra TaxID=3108543 RepID=A0ABP1CB88_9GAMM
MGHALPVLGHSLPTLSAATKPAVLVLCGLWLAGCASAPPKNPADLCALFRERDGWYAAALRAERRWGLPVPVQMAIINRESGFVEDARPPRYRFLGVIPLWRLSSAYGYGQVKDATWDWYRATTGQADADRDAFEDVVDFVAWYGHQSRSQLGISPYDAYRHYLAYHEGHAGYRRGSYRAKPGLKRVARQVAADARRYRRQLAGCQAALARTLTALE